MGYNKNFYSRWSDEQLKDVIIPLMGKMSLPMLDVETLREFNMVDSESIFMHASLSQDRLLRAFNNAVKLYYVSKWSIDKIYAIWAELPDYTEDAEKKPKIQEYIEQKHNHYPVLSQPKTVEGMSIDKHYAEYVKLPEKPACDISQHYKEHTKPTPQAGVSKNHYAELNDHIM